MALDNNRVGLTTGIVFSGVHFVWALLVALGLAKPLADFVVGMHFMQNPMAMTSFSLGKALMLVVLAFVVAYAVGWLFASVYNKLGSK